MKMSVLGTGAIGGYLGGKLANAQNDVVFIARDKTLEALKANGLQIQSYTGNFVIEKPQVTSDLNELKNSDIILLCVKSYSTREVADAIKPLLSDNNIIISVQNGIDNETILSEVLGTSKVIGAVIYISSSCPEPGIINHAARGNLILGELNGEITDRIQNIQKLFLNATIPTTISTNIQKELWKKLMLNVPFNGFSVLLKKPLKSYFEIPESLECFYDSLKEIQLIARYEGYNITDEEVEEIFNVSKSPKMVAAKSSTLQDLEAGKALEIESLQGSVIKIARKHNLNIPISKFLYSILKAIYA